MNRQMHEAIMNESWTRAWHSNRIYLMIKDATNLFVYWEIDSVHRNLVSEHFQCQWKDLRCVLRLNDVTLLDFDGRNCPSSRKFAVPPEADNWYMHGATPARRYLVDFGVETKAGEFLALLRSNVVEMPPSKPSHRVEPLLRFSSPARNYKGNRTEISASTESAAAWQLTFDGYSLVSGEGGKR